MISTKSLEVKFFRSPKKKLLKEPFLVVWNYKGVLCVAILFFSHKINHLLCTSWSELTYLPMISVFLEPLKTSEQFKVEAICILKFHSLQSVVDPGI